MNSLVRSEKGIWTLAFIGAALVVAVVMLLFRAPVPVKISPPLATEIPATMGFRSVKSTDTAINLLDPTPLFLPTEWNARPNAMPADAVREPGSTFGTFPAQVSFKDDVIDRVFPPPTRPVPEKPLDALEVIPPIAAFAGIGESTRAVQALAVRDAFVEISAEGTGRVVLAEAVRGVRPSGDVSWQPLEFMAVIQAAGLVGQPTLVGSGSGFEQVDTFFQNYLVKGLRVGERLAPGFYRIKIGP